MTTQNPAQDVSDAVIAALHKVRSRANQSGTSTQHGTVFAEGLLCAANMIEAALIKAPAARELRALAAADGGGK